MAPTTHHILDHFFRHSYGSLIAVLAKQFGPPNLDLIEDVVQSVLLKALDQMALRRGAR